jgi:DNA-binding XRE family transcriptional regulator
MKRGSQSHEETIKRIKEVRAQAIEHTRQARKFHVERRDLMQQLIDDGWSQADIARELGVTRQAIQKMMSLSMVFQACFTASPQRPHVPHRVVPRVERGMTC